jgi:YaiO family outer membrane protein
MALFPGYRAFAQKTAAGPQKTVAGSDTTPADLAKMDADQLTALARREMIRGQNYPYALILAHRAIGKNGRDIDLRFLLGKLYQLNNYPDSAEEVMKDILYQDPQYRDAYAALAAIELGRHNAEEALCFVDDGLYYYPADKEFALKKFTILQAMQRPVQADAQGDLLLDQYGRDTSVLRTYINYKMESAQRYTKSRDYTRALYEYRQVLSLDPGNREALEGTYNTQLKEGNYGDALSGVSSALNDRPEDYDLLFKKMSLLQDMHRYPEAIGVLQHLLKVYPSDARARQLDIDLRMEAGRYFMSEDPYLQFQGVLEKSPSNREALDYVINLASARGLNRDALVFVNKALRYYPTDGELLSKKISILESLQKYTEASDIAGTLWRSSGKAAAYRDQYIELKEASGRSYMNQLQYDSALADFHEVLDISPAEPSALNYSINILAAQKNYDGAVALLDKALKYYPASEGLLLKKAGILQDDTRYPEALALLAQLMNSYPENGRYKSSYVDLSLTLGRQMMQAQDYDAAYGTFSGILQLQPDNQEALGTMINIGLARGANAADAQASLDTALFIAGQALTYYPGSREFLLKKASVLEALRRYPEAYAITGDLMKRYPYNVRIRDQYTDELLASGRLYNSQGQTDSALAEFGKVLDVRPRDSAALAYSVNILNTKGVSADGSSGALLDSALVLIDRGLRYYPGNEYFVLKRAVVLENLNRFAEALPAADSVAKMDPTPDHKDYADYLRSKTFRNAIGLSYLSSHFDSLVSANIATLHYTRYSASGSSFDTKLNFAGRVNGTGLQLEEEIYYTHNKVWSSYGDLAISNEAVFPRIRAAYSLFRNFSGGWEGELGFRYLDLDSISVTSAVGSIAKYFGNFYVNARGYLIFAPGKLYEAGVLTARQYLDNKTDFLFGTIGVGDSPDEFSRNYQLNNELGSQTYSIGAGYQKAFSYRNILNLSGTWYNQKLAAGRYRNQYDISLSFLRKF